MTFDLWRLWLVCWSTNWIMWFLLEYSDDDIVRMRYTREAIVCIIKIVKYGNCKLLKWLDKRTPSFSLFNMVYFAKSVGIVFILFLSLPPRIWESCIKWKLTYFFIFILLCGVSKGFMKSLVALIKTFEAPQRSVKVKAEFNFFSSSGILRGVFLRPSATP